jgi:hypothetical protein
MAQSQRPSSVNKRRSRYTQGGQTTRYPRRLGWWERRILRQRDDDIFHTITSIEAKRPDLIAYHTYGDPNLAWLVMQYNNIVDNVTELTEGTEIRLPTKQRVTLSILTGSTGGVPPQNNGG